MEIAKSITIYRTGIDSFETNAHAKLNIDLDILRKSKNGMHLIRSTMQTISMCDRVTLERLPKGKAGTGRIEVMGPVIPGNLAEKAIAKVMDRLGRRLDCRICIPSKAIPDCAGLGGGSSDAAAVIRLANAAYELGMSAEKMCRIAHEVGNDVPFFVYGGRAEVSGENQGTIMHIYPRRLYYLIARPQIRLSTEKMYKLHDETGKSFVELASGLCPETKRLLECLRKGPAECGVTGKGPTVFAGFKSYAECVEALPRISWFEGKGMISIEEAVS